ncbi:protein of unknown function [Pseudomonas sp. JV241A]|nr:protein of unknown function [Pseudomonas sp. JV241A]
MIGFSDPQRKTPQTLICGAFNNGGRGRNRTGVDGFLVPKLSVFNARESRILQGCPRSVLELIFPPPPASCRPNTIPSSPATRHPELVRITLPRLLHIQTALIDRTVIIEEGSFALGKRSAKSPSMAQAGSQPLGQQLSEM